MRNLKRRFERFTAIALAVLMVVTTVDLSTFAVSAAGEGSGTYCEHHAEHTSECGYTEGIEGSPCTHEHGEECYSEVTVCVHNHDESCGYVEGVEDSCTHICSLENGCIISALNCTHEHDEACGYQAAVEGTPCIFECEECANVGSDTVSGNEVSEETTECTCETDDPAFHATNCPAYITPENAQCFCAEKCTEDTLNVWCDVCGVQGVSACQGEDTAVAYEIVANGTCGAEGNESSVTWSLDSDGTLTISGSGAMADYEQVETYPIHYTTPWHDTDNDGEYQNSNIKKVVVEEGITHIGNAAFRDFTELTSISIPNTVKSIGYRSVSYCGKLESLVIPDSVTSIGEEAFDYNVMLTSVTIGNSVESIGAYAFSYAGVSAESNFTITLPKSVTSIDSKAFSQIYKGATIRYSCSYNAGNGYSAESTKATLEKYHLCEYSSSGNKINCSGCTCGEYSSSTATLSLSSDEPIYYTGEEIKPAVTVTYPDDWGGDKIEPNESNCTYSDNINAGAATCTFKYAEGVEASLDFTIAECPHWGVDSDGMCDNCDYLDEPELVGEYYQIANAGNLMWFAQQVNEGQTAINAKLTADIDMKDIDWTTMSSFAGTFDGDGHTILYLCADENGGDDDIADGSRCGLFQTLAEGGTVTNLTISGAQLWSAHSAGAIAAVNNGTISKCIVKDSTIELGASHGLAAIAGTNTGTVTDCGVVNCFLQRRYSAANSNTFAIGVVVEDNSGTVSNCFSYGCTFNNSPNLYAIVESGNAPVNCYYYTDATVSDTVATAKTADQFASGEVAYLLNGSTSTGELVWGQTLTGENAQVYPVLNGDKVYRYESVKCDSSSKDPAVYGYSNEEKSDVIDEHNVDSNGFCTACGAYEKPETDENGVYQISNAGELYWFADKVNNDNANYGSANAKLTADIVVNSDENISSYNGTDSVSWRPWTPIGNNSNIYTGTFDGNNKTVSGLYFNNTSQNYVGLFGYLGDGEIKNVGVVNSYFNGENYVGGVCGRNYGTITNCYNTGTVVGAYYVGGVCSYNSGGTIKNCYNTGCVSGTSDYVGGVCGYNSGGTIENCYNTGCVSGTYSCVGGVCGYNYVGPIKNCYYDNTVYTGNAVSSNYNGTLTSVEGKSTDQFASGEVTYLLNGEKTDGTQSWYQTLETDSYPVLDNTHRTVYSVCKCDGMTPAGYYSNVKENEPHTDVNPVDNVCDVCNANLHTHEWTYTASDATITAECGAADCPLNGAAKTIVISASDKTYDGTAVVATVENNVDTTDYSLSIVYKDSEDVAIDDAINAGRYTANLTVGGVTAKVEFAIAKVTPDIGTVSAADMENTLDVSQVVLSRSNETVPGTLSLAEGTTLQYGTNDYTYVFKSGDANYNDVEGTVSITISDTNAPTATYKVGTDDWKQFINTITFGHFCKDHTTVDITYSDEGSGLADTQYYISDVEITNTANIQWSEYTDTLKINATGKYYIYVKVTDNDGNVVIQNSEGIVVYAESVITPTSFSCEYGEENDLSVNISANGNTFANLTDGSGNEIATENYSIAGSTLTIKGEYLSNLDVGEYTYKICMNPQGVENTEVTLSYGFTIKVEKRTLTVERAYAASRYYIANDETVDITGITLSGIQGTDDVSVNLTGVKGTLSSDNAGTYTSLTLPELTLTGADKGNYELVQPTGPVTVQVGIEKLNAEIIVEYPSYGKIFGDSPFSLGVSDNNPEAEVTYESDNEDVATVTSEGIVTIHKVGLAQITVSLAESTNYISADSKQIAVFVAKKDGYTVDTINKNYLYAISNDDSINLAELLPEDCGTVNYASVTYNGALTFTSEDTKPKVTNGILAYTLESGADDDTGNIVVVVETQNYEDITITVNVTLIDQIPVNVDGEVELNSNVLTYGETLSGLTFKSVDFVDNAGNEVAGTLAWKDPSATPNAGTTSATWVFTPNNAEYASVEGTVAITVNKATPNVTGVPTVADRVYNPSVVLADSDLTGGTVKGVDGNSLAGGWSWQSTNVVPVVNNSGYIAVFTPTDSTNYETVTRTITVNVTKATPYVATKPTASALIYGQTLNQSVLSNGVIHYSETDSTIVAGSFAWEAGTVKPAVTDSATTLYNVLFTPDDSDNYKEVTVKLTVSVSKAEATALNNANKTYVYAESKNGESVSIEGLPEDCGSVSYEISSISDTNNMLENVSVDATGKLTYDVKSLNAYSNGLSATVTVTVSMQNYEDLTYTLTVVRTDKLVQNISAENISLTFGDNDTDIVVTGNKTELSYRVVDDSNENGDVVTVDSTGKVHIVNSGTATVEIKAEGSSSYAEAICEIQVTVAKRTVNVPAKDDTVYTYTGLPQTYSIASSPFYTIENTTQTNAGTYDVAVSLISDNYQWSAVLPEYKFVIKPAQVTITAESHTVKQGDELPAFTYITTGLVNGENLPITVSVTCSATNSETVGTYDIVVSGPANEGNYTYTYKKGTLEVLAEDEAPFIMGDDGKMGWDAISDAIDDAGESENIKVDMNGATVVPGDIIEEARDKGITISFVLDNGLTWTIDGSTVTDGEINNINFGTTVEDENNPLNNIPVDVINGVTGEKATIEVNLTYSGNFGFTAGLKANLGSDNAGYYANLYYYNPTTGKLEYVCADMIAANGDAELTFTHASDYLIVIDDEDLGKVKEDTNTNTNTGNNTNTNTGNNNTDNNSATTTPAATNGTVSNNTKVVSPDTGDEGAFWIWMLMLASLLGMAGAIGTKRVSGKKN